MLTAVLEFFGQKEIIGILVGAIGTLTWYRFRTSYEQSEKNKRVIKLLKGNLHLNIKIVEGNLGIVGNELRGLPEKLTLSPLTSFHPSSGDLLLLISSLRDEKSLSLWNHLKEIDSLSNQFQNLTTEVLRLKRAMKTESRQEILMFELTPYLQGFDQLIMDNLLKIKQACHSAMNLIEQIER